MYVSYVYNASLRQNYDLNKGDKNECCMNYANSRVFTVAVVVVDTYDV